MTAKCPKASCQYTSDVAVRVPGAPTRYVIHDKPPYNRVKKQKVKCRCGQVYWRFVACYIAEETTGLVWEE